MSHTGTALMDTASKGVLRTYVGDAAEGMSVEVSQGDIIGTSLLGDGRAAIVVTVSDVTVSELFDALAGELNAARPTRRRAPKPAPEHKETEIPVEDAEPDIIPGADESPEPDDEPEVETEDDPGDDF